MPRPLVYVYVRKRIQSFLSTRKRSQTYGFFVRLGLPSTRKRRKQSVNGCFRKRPPVDKFVNVQQCTFFYSRVDNTTCKRLCHRVCTHAQLRFRGNSGSQAASFYSSVMHLQLSFRLRVDRRKRYVRGSSLTCGQKTVWTGP